MLAHAKDRKRSGFAALEAVVYGAAAIMALTSLAVYFKMTAQGRMRTQSDAMGPQFSAEWSSYVSTSYTYERAKNTIKPSGESEMVLLDHAIADQRGGVDNFSGKGIQEESLYR